MASRSTDPLGLNSEHPPAEPGTPTQISTPAAHASSRKRSRQNVIIDEMEADTLSGVPLIKKSKKATSPQVAASTVSCPSIDPLAGPSSSFSFKPNVQVTAHMRNPPSEAPSIDHAKSTTVSAIDHSASVADDLQLELNRLHREVAHLKEQLGLQVKNQEAAKLQTIQQMMLDRIREQKDSNGRLEKLRRQKSYATQYAKEQEAECEKQTKKVEDCNKKYAKLLADMNYLKDETEHLQVLNKAMEEDLDELRRIDNEDRTERHHNKHDLPPAYGSLDDEDPSTILLHKDSGTFEIAALKRTVNYNFSLELRKAQMTADTLRASDAEAVSADSVIFVQTSLALAQSSRALKVALDRAEHLSVTTIAAADEKPATESSSHGGKSVEKHHVHMRKAARRAFVADRVAKIVLNLVWRVISATELRPVTLKLQTREKTMLCLAYKELDDCFHEALRHSFILGEPERPSIGVLHDYQYYLTQISGLRRSFSNLGAGLSYSLFAKSGEWLSEEVELERMKRANKEQSQSGGLTLEDVFRQPAAGSEVSSEEATSNSDAGESALVAPVR